MGERGPEREVRGLKKRTGYWGRGILAWRNTQFSDTFSELFSPRFVMFVAVVLLYLFCMLLVIQPQTSDRLDILSCQRREQRFHFLRKRKLSTNGYRELKTYGELPKKTYCNLLSHIMLAENFTLDHTRLGGFCEIGLAVGEDRVAVVCTAVLGQESDQSLRKTVSSASKLVDDSTWAHRELGHGYDM